MRAPSPKVSWAKHGNQEQNMIRVNDFGATSCLEFETLGFWTQLGKTVTGDSTRPVVKAPEPDPEKLARELKQAKRALEDLKKQNKQLERKCKTAQSAKVRLIERHAVQVASLRAKKEAILENFLKDLRVVPAALFKIMMQKKKWINWDTEKEAMELCLTVYFRSTSAYAVLCSIGF
ncbi:hypothetical protein ACOMHN_002638 [Nucella lapillus]